MKHFEFDAATNSSFNPPSFLSLSSHKIFATLRRPKGKAALMTTGGIKPFDESRILVRLREPEESGEGTTFIADEEPHFLKPDLGYGFNPLNLGERLRSGKVDRTYEIVRKLGFGGGSSVWLVKFIK
jgi:hypothetical protein